MFKHQIEITSDGFGISKVSNSFVFEQLKKCHYATKPNDSGLVFLLSGGGDCFRMDGMAGGCLINRNMDWCSISTINTQYINPNIFVSEAQVNLYPCNGNEYRFDFDKLNCLETESNTIIDFSFITT